MDTVREERAYTLKELRISLARARGIHVGLPPTVGTISEEQT